MPKKTDSKQDTQDKLDTKDSQEKQEPKKEWIPIYRKQLHDAIMYAKGDLSMAEFAKRCGLNPMTLSRAINNNIEKPLKEETIRTMAKISGKPDILEYLMRANGYVKNDDEERRQEFEQYLQERNNCREKIQSVIMGTLFDNGYTIMPIFHTPLEDTDPMLKESKHFLRTKVRFALRVRSTEPQGFEPDFWNFTYQLFSAEGLSDKKENYEREIKRQTRRMIDMTKDIFLRDMWEPEAFDKSLYSIVFTNKDLFESYYKVFEDVSLNGSVSLILIDLDNQQVVEERFLSRRDGRKDESLFRSKQQNNQ